MLNQAIVLGSKIARGAKQIKNAGKQVGQGLRANTNKSIKAKNPKNPTKSTKLKK